MIHIHYTWLIFIIVNLVFVYALVKHNYEAFDIRPLLKVILMLLFNFIWFIIF